MTNYLVDTRQPALAFVEDLRLECRCPIPAKLDRTGGVGQRRALVINRLTLRGSLRLTALADAEKPGMTQLMQRMERLGCSRGAAAPKTAEHRWS